MIAEQRVVLCMRELRRPCDCHDELRCPPHTTYADMEAAIKALGDEDAIILHPEPELIADESIKYKRFDRLYLAFWATYVLACAGVLGWVIYSIFGGHGK